MGDLLRDAIGAAVAPYLVDGQEQDIGIADAVIDALASLPLPVILDTLGIPYDKGWHSEDHRRGGCAPWRARPRPCSVVYPATDEAHDA